MSKSTVCMTEYSHGSGCGCKIAPKLLDQILQSTLDIMPDPRLLVGNQSRDDAAVYGDGYVHGHEHTESDYAGIVDEVSGECGDDYGRRVGGRDSSGDDDDHGEFVAWDAWDGLAGGDGCGAGLDRDNAC